MFKWEANLPAKKGVSRDGQTLGMATFGVSPNFFVNSPLQESNFENSSTEMLGGINLYGDDKLPIEVSIFKPFFRGILKI